MFNYGLVLGYHGCSTDVAAAVLRNKITHLELSTSNNEWLGDGVYFWENSYDRAMQWAKTHLKEGQKPAVLAALIIPGNCLDLTDSKSIADLESVVKLFESSYPLLNKGKQVPKNNGLKHSYDCALVNFYHTVQRRAKKPPVNTVRAPFIEGKPIGGHGCSFRAKNHIQWAVRTPSESIVGYFAPREFEQPYLDIALSSGD